jgi:hypothetical protein
MERFEIECSNPSKLLSINQIRIDPNLPPLIGWKLIAYLLDRLASFRDSTGRLNFMKMDEFLGCWLLLLLGLASGCRSIPTPATQEPSTPLPRSYSLTNQESTIYVHLPRRLHPFIARQKLNPAWWFGNADEPEAPDWYRPGSPCRDFLWHLRNPCHNFTFYVIGIADKPFTRIGRFPARADNPGGGWNWAMCRRKRLRLPFIDYHRGRFEFYCGWRNGGNFGIKLNFAQAKRREAKQQGAVKSN